jgi:hypothetical protein
MPSTPIATARLGILDLLEELGSAATLLREAQNDLDHGNPSTARLCADDVVGILAIIESRASEIAANLAKWSDCGANDQTEGPAEGRPSQPE